MGEAVSIKQARELSDRIEAATRFIADMGEAGDSSFTWPAVLDSTSNEFNTLFGAWPTRFYVAEGSTLTFKIELDFERKFDVGDLRAFITQRVAHGSQTDTY